MKEVHTDSETWATSWYESSFNRFTRIFDTYLNWVATIPYVYVIIIDIAL